MCGGPPAANDGGSTRRHRAGCVRHNVWATTQRSLSMLRKLMGVFAVALLLCVGVVMADEIRGRIMKVDVDKKTMTISVDGKETTYPVADDAEYPKGKDGAEGSLKSVAKRVENSKDKGVRAKLTTDKKKGKDVVTKVEYEQGKGKGKDKGDKDK